MDVHIRPFTPADTQAVVALWKRCDLVRPQNDPYKDIRRKLRVQPEMFLVAVVGHEIAGTIMGGYEGHRGWINYLAVDPAHRLKGIGRAMMNRVEQQLREIGCPKINLQVRTGNTDAIEFYRRVGLHVDDVVSMGRRLEEDGD
jgi:ribosomal protein S18 acetylase RimI-like enzyme